MDLTNQFAESRQTEILQDSPGGKQVAEILQAKETKEAEEIREQADKMYQNAGLQNTGPTPENYDYESLRAAGGSLKPVDVEGQKAVDLPNRFMKPRQAQVGGFDLVTGEKIRSDWQDPQGLIQNAQQLLQQSSTNNVTGHPINDVEALSQAGYGVILEGGSFGDFLASVPKSFNKNQIDVAWRAANRVQDRIELEQAFNAGEYDDLPNEALPVFEEKIHPDNLPTTPGFLNAARKVYKHWEGKDFEGSNDELADFGQEILSMFNYNVPVQAGLTLRAKNGPQEFKEGLFDLLTIDENVQVTWGSFWRATAATALDATTYAALGGGKIAIKAAQTGAKKALLKVLKASIAGTAYGATESAVFSSVDEYARQRVAVEAGQKEEIDAGEVAEAAAWGAGVDATLGTAAGAALSDPVKKFASDQVGKVRDYFRRSSRSREADPEALKDALEILELRYGTEVAEQIRQDAIGNMSMVLE